MKKLLSFSIALLLLLSTIQMTAFAVDNPQYSKKPTSGIESTDPYYGEDFHTVVPSAGKDSMNSAASSESTAEITNYGCTITKTSSSSVQGYAKTRSNIIVNEIGYTMYIQMWDGYDWINIGSTNNSKTNVNIVEGYRPNSAASGNYYRTYAEHYIIVNGTTTMVTSTSSYISL